MNNYDYAENATWERYLTLLEQLPAMVWCTDCHGNPIYFNKQWLDFAGSSLVQEINYGWAERVHPLDLKKFMVKQSLALAGERPYHHVFRMLNKQGKYRKIGSWARPFYNDLGHFIGYISLNYDLTDKQHIHFPNIDDLFLTFDHTSGKLVTLASGDYYQQLSTNSLEKLKLIKNLKNAIKNSEQIQLLYQPQYHARTGKIIGLEALVRWQHPKLGTISPKEFIPLAEETGFILPLGEIILRKACRQGKKWQQEGIVVNRVAVNISTCQLKFYGFVDTVANILKDTGFNPEQLGLEITESYAMAKEECLAALQRLKKLGVRIAIDDFGTGYSSLDCLSMSPIDLIKIDRSFISHLNDANNKAIVTAIIAMACTLGIEVVAEGVETKEQFSFLKRTNCRYLQGYYFNKPLPAEEIQKPLINQQKKSV